MIAAAEEPGAPRRLAGMSEDPPTPSTPEPAPGGAPSLRASDADRDAVATTLQQAMAEGRLDPAEFQTRLDATYAARTQAELEPITRDLPPVRSAAGQVVPARRGLLARMDVGTKAAWGSWLTATLVCTVIWLLSDPGGYFWPGWVAGPWGAVLLARTLTGRHGPQERPGRRDGERDHL